VSTPALAAAEAVGLAHRVIRHGPVRNLAEAARARGVAPADVVKTLRSVRDFARKEWPLRAVRLTRGAPELYGQRGG